MVDSAKRVSPASVRLRPSAYLADSLDEQIEIVNHVKALKPPEAGWIRAVRDVLGMAATDVAMKLQISQPAVTKLEASELPETISVGKLREVAEALNCELVYGFVPRHSFVEMALKVKRKQDAARKAKRKIPRASA